MKKQKRSLFVTSLPKALKFLLLYTHKLRQIPPMQSFFNTEFQFGRYAIRYGNVVKSRGNSFCVSWWIIGKCSWALRVLSVEKGSWNSHLFYYSFMKIICKYNEDNDIVCFIIFGLSNVIQKHVMLKDEPLAINWIQFKDSTTDNVWNYMDEHVFSLLL